AQGVVVMPAQFFVEVFDREVLVFLVVQTPHPVQFALRRTPVRDTAEPFVAQTVDTFGLVTDALAAEVAAGQAQQSTRFLGGQMTFLMPIERIQETPHVRLPQNKVPAHSRSPEQITNNADNSPATNRGQQTRSLHRNAVAVFMPVSWRITYTIPTVRCCLRRFCRKKALRTACNHHIEPHPVGWPDSRQCFGLPWSRQRLHALRRRSYGASQRRQQ